MREPRFGLRVIHDPAFGWRVALNGRGIGPWMMEENSAIFAMKFLAASHQQIGEVLLELRVELTFEQAIGIEYPDRSSAIDHRPTDEQITHQPEVS
jgi:hypothetical protein